MRQKNIVMKTNQYTCGRRLVHHESLITNGFESNEGDWLWYVTKNNLLFRYIRILGMLPFFTYEKCSVDLLVRFKQSRNIGSYK